MNPTLRTDLHRSFVLGPLLLLLAQCGCDKGDTKMNEYQTKADAMPWNWGEESNILLCCSAHLDDYTVEVTKARSAHGKVTMRILDGNQEVFEYEGHPGTSFTRIGSVIYLAEFDPIASGCSIVAYELRERKELWKTPLVGLGNVLHSRYLNSVNVSTDGNVLLVQGKESGGKYIEFVDPTSGQRLAAKVFAEDK